MGNKIVQMPIWFSCKIQFSFFQIQYIGMILYKLTKGNNDMHYVWYGIAEIFQIGGRVENVLAGSTSSFEATVLEST